MEVIFSNCFTKVNWQKLKISSEDVAALLGAIFRCKIVVDCVSILLAIHCIVSQAVGDALAGWCWTLIQLVHDSWQIHARIVSSQTCWWLPLCSILQQSVRRQVQWCGSVPICATMIRNELLTVETYLSERLIHEGAWRLASWLAECTGRISLGDDWNLRSLHIGFTWRHGLLRLLRNVQRCSQFILVCRADNSKLRRRLVLFVWLDLIINTKWTSRLVSRRWLTLLDILVL